jgi:DNA-binding NtrC family response regulator
LFFKTGKVKKILIIEDEDKLRKLLSRIIGLEGFEVIEASDTKTALKKLEMFDISVVLCDVKLPDGNGIDLTKEIKIKYPLIEIIVLTAYGNIPDGVMAIKNGAFDYMTKGDDNNKILPALNRAMEKAELSKRVLSLERRLDNKYNFGSIIGNSPLIKNVISLAIKVAESDTTVLLTGETGTGKEVFANAIHQSSNRKTKSFVAINCSAFNHELLENEFFGHKAGAFSGAAKDHKGLFEEANNGTIFLDEIGELAMDLQVKLLRIIETGEFFRLGESKPTKVNVRIIAATNRDLQQEIVKGNFREDLYYRISVFQLNLPPLRDRVNDIALFAHHFMQIFAGKANKKIDGISEQCQTALNRHNWRGNIRELRNVMERCVIMAEGNKILFEHLPPEIQNNSRENKEGTIVDLDLSQAEKSHITKVLQMTNGNKARTASLLGIALTTLYRKLSEYTID